MQMVTCADGLSKSRRVTVASSITNYSWQYKALAPGTTLQVGLRPSTETDSVSTGYSHAVKHMLMHTLMML